MFYYDPPGYSASYGNYSQPYKEPSKNKNSQSEQKCGLPTAPHVDTSSSIINQPNKNEYKYSAKNDPSLFLQDASSTMKYPDVYGNREFLQVPQENLIDDPSWFLSIDSSDRDRSKYPNPFKYTIYMVGSSDQQNVTGHRYKNIHSIELISAILPNVEEITDELYIILQIDELRDVGFNSSNQNLQQAYAKLVMHKHLNDNFLLLDADNSRPLKRIYYPSLKGSLDKLTITLKKPNGDIINLGPDSDPDQPPIKDIQNSFTFRIISKIPDVSAAIGHRNI